MSSWQEKLRPWLGRLAFSFVILGAVCLFEGWKALKREGQATRTILCFVGAGACMALGGQGMRERHRRRDQD